ncbi:hypothetical protein EV652_1069 [Kribbella steppae]|uniref:Uncharacterized protein n=1 Tax=Kribbella steppae TaxID=2512223 RepID=A0A4R2HGD3_9ACTN|nr:hypothetical protein [Kribbella steppae]TCO28027.1 hypothetical protein EV652_1069 [Kribbella steppae]
MATHQGTRNDRRRAGALSGEHRGRAKNLTDPSGVPVRVVADTDELATLTAKIADQVAMRSIGYSAAHAAVLRGRL